MKCRVLYKANEEIAVIHPVPKSKKPTETEEEWLDRIFTRAMANEDYVDYEDIEKSSLPSGDTRAGWKGNKSTGIIIDQVKLDNFKNEVEKAELIEQKKNELAEAELKKEGKIDANGKVVK